MLRSVTTTESRNLLGQGVTIQLASVFALGVQSFVGPRLLGAEAYGTATALLTVPLIVQAVIDAVVVPLVIREGSVHEKSRIPMGILIRDTFVAVGVGIGLLTGLVAFHIFPIPQELVVATLCAANAWLILVACTTWKLAQAYKRDDLTGVGVTYFSAGLATAAAFGVFGMFGAIGAIFAFIVGQASALAVLSWRAAKSHGVRPVARAPGAEMRAYEILAERWRVYGALLAPRIAQLALGPGTLLFAAVTMLPPELTAYKVSLSLIAGCGYAFPIAPTVLQIATQRVRFKDVVTLPRLLAYFILTLGLTTALLISGGSIVEIITGVDHQTAHKFKMMFLSVPAYVAIGPVAALLVARQQEGAMTIGVLAMTLSMAVGWAAGGIPIALVAGSISFVAGSMFVVARAVGNMWAEGAQSAESPGG